MNKKALAATLLAALALTGCAQTAPAAPAYPKVTVATAAQPAPSNIYYAVHQAWKGDDAPSKPWIDDAATLVCKQILGGIEPTVVPGNAHNNEVVVAAAERYVCDIDRKG